MVVRLQSRDRGRMIRRWFWWARLQARNEDEQGVPFCGDAGKYLNAALEYVGLSRDEVYVTNVVKCRPPGNRDPKTEEIDECKRWLREELMRLKPEVIVTLGRFAAEQMLGRKVAIMKDRGKAEPKWICSCPTYSPKLFGRIRTAKGASLDLSSLCSNKSIIYSSLQT